MLRSAHFIERICDWLATSTWRSACSEQI